MREPRSHRAAADRPWGGSEPVGTTDSGTEPVPAPLRFRLAAMLYDGVALTGIWVLTIVALVTATGDEVTGPPLQALLVLEAYAFFAFFWIRRGQTLGMVAWRLRFHPADGTIGLREVHLRLLGGILSLACLLLGHVWLLADRRRRAWPDLLSGRRVVRLSREAARGSGRSG